MYILIQFTGLSQIYDKFVKSFVTINYFTYICDKQYVSNHDHQVLNMLIVPCIALN